LVRLVDVWLSRLCDGFAVFIGGLLGVPILGTGQRARSGPSYTRMKMKKTGD
jgi:hypothetical protein